MSHTPLVSVICLCYNQERFVKEAIESVWNQSYSNIELIIVDDCSTDGSKTTIKSLISGRSAPFIDLKENAGNTTAFNLGLKISKGDYIIDLAADDVLHKSRIEKQVAFFQSCGEKVGVIYSDANIINEDGQIISTHYANKNLTPLSGNIYEKVICKYFISSPTMMVKRKVFEEIGGYDESLTYEDFDFWIRSSRIWEYAFQLEKLTSVRRHSDSLSKGWYKKGDKQLYSTYLICEKIKGLNRSENENKALKNRLKFEIRQSVFSGNYTEANLFIGLLKEMKGFNTLYAFLEILNRSKLNLSFLRNIYHLMKLKWN